MTKLLVVLMAVFLTLSFSMVGLAAEQKAAGSSPTTVAPEKAIVKSEKKANIEKSGMMEVATGKVASIDPQGKAITITEKIAGKGDMDVGAIVEKDTIVKISGKEASLKDIKVGDTVTIHYLKSNDLYAKEISKA
jgi:hypothetical protein